MIGSVTTWHQDPEDDLNLYHLGNLKSHI